MLMLRKLRRRFHENFIFRFFIGHFLTLLAVLAICSFGFHRSYRIVRADILASVGFSLSQGVSAIDRYMEGIYNHGLQTVRGDGLPELAVMDESDPEYFIAAREMIHQYYRTLLYLPQSLSQQSFCYLSDADRIIFADAFYSQEAFARPMKNWGLTDDEWQRMKEDTTTVPHFVVTENGGFYYLFNCMAAVSSNEKIGMAVYRTTSQTLLEYLSFLDNYEGYRLAVYDKNGMPLLAEDTADSAEPLPADWQTAQLMQSEEDIILRADGVSSIGLHYLLFLPKQQAMQKLRILQFQTDLLILMAWTLGVAVSLFFSTRNGRPINEIARTLSGSEKSIMVDLDHLSSAVGQLLQDNRQLLHQQESNLPALQNKFFHNLLKSGFVSSEEMSDMAAKANIQLTGNTYCAALLRLFPQIDADSLDGQTAEDARVLHILISEQINESCHHPVWSYKRNTLAVLYIFEMRDQKAPLQIMRETTKWLKEKYRVISLWGVSRPCGNLLQFWRSAEEAGEALSSGDGSAEVILYESTFPAADAYYLPYIVENRLVQSLRTGDTSELQTVLDLLKEENNDRRRLNRSQFLRLNQRIMDTLMAQDSSLTEESAELEELSRLALDCLDDRQPYFAALETISQEICRKTDSKRSTRRVNTVAAVEQYLCGNYRDPSLSLAKVSDTFGLSEGYLSAIFKKATGVNFAEYLEQLRIKAACALLEDGRKVTAVSEYVGYNSIQSFRRAFKRVKGVSPSEYKR